MTHDETQLPEEELVVGVMTRLLWSSIISQGQRAVVQATVSAVLGTPYLTLARVLIIRFQSATLALMQSESSRVQQRNLI